MKKIIHFKLLLLTWISTIWCTNLYGEKCPLKYGEKGICFPTCFPSINASEYETQRNSLFCGTFQNKLSGEITTLYCCPKRKSEIECLTYYKQAPPAMGVAFGTKALSKEFPHMAILGYGNESNIQWLCGGSLISDRFVLTAAHCLATRELGPVKFVRLGDLDIASTTDDADPQDFTVLERHLPRNYTRSLHYHDIALLKLDRRVKFTDYVKPACLQAEKFIFNLYWQVTGWGKTENQTKSTHLLKATLQPVDHPTCAQRFASPSRRLKNGIDDDLQICAGDASGKDTCQGDSGGPLQIMEGRKPEYYNIIGVTSFGKFCGTENSIGVYTRVSNYIQWIEDIVWPEDDDKIYFLD